MQRTGMRHYLCPLFALLLGAYAVRAEAQAVSMPTRAWALGWSPAAGLVGVELVARSFSPTTRVGGAAGIGIGGAGVRLNVALREPRAHNRVPYVAAGIVAVAWLPTIAATTVTTIEGGVQFWPQTPRRFYMDLGAGIGFQDSTPDWERIVPAVRIVFGRTF